MIRFTQDGEIDPICGQSRLLCDGLRVHLHDLCCLLHRRGGRAVCNCDDFDKDKDEEHVDVHNIVEEVDNCDDEGDDVEDEDEEFVYLYNLCCRGGES